MVGTADVRFPIRLEGLADEHGRFSSVRSRRASLSARPPLLLPTMLSLPTLCVVCVPCCCPGQYEPELFPGLVYRLQKPKVVMLIFVSGKVVVTGAKVGHRYASAHYHCGARYHCG